MASIREKYNRVSTRYNLMELPMELTVFPGWRKKVQYELRGPLVLEVGVGTGKNIPYHNQEWDVVAFDISEGMLSKIDVELRERVHLLQMDTGQMGFPDNRFDSVFDTFVFCSVPEAVQGLQEIHRVLKPGGRFVALEHMRPENNFAGKLFDLADPLTMAASGVHVNRQTVENIQEAGFEIIEVRYLFTSVVRLIIAVKSVAWDKSRLIQCSERLLYN